MIGSLIFLGITSLAGYGLYKAGKRYGSRKGFGVGRYKR